jgi:putative phosphoesterase
VAVAIFSDVHGNLPALDAVLADSRERCVDAVYCLGDLVGYGASPNEVIARVRDGRIPTIVGNYDDGVGHDRDECGCAYREEAQRRLGDESLRWTRAHVTPENKAFLRALPFEIRLEIGGRRVLLVHGSPRKLNEYLFEDRPDASFARLAAASAADVIVFGHTHLPYTKSVDDVWFVNVGSVGKPKDGDWRACYAILDPASTPPAVFVRVPYDVQRAAAAIRASDLPDEFAADVETGGRAAETTRGSRVAGSGTRGPSTPTTPFTV